MADNQEPEFSNALVSCPSTITLDSLASPTNYLNGSGLWYRSLCLSDFVIIVCILGLVLE